MGFLCFCRTLVTALVAATFVQATPFGALAGLDMGLTRRDTYVVEQCKNLVYGNNRIPIGTVCVSLSGGCLTIKYTITSTGWSFQEVHAWAGTSVPTENAPGQFPYASGKGYPDKSSPPACTLSGNVYTCKVCNIPKEWRGCSGSLYIAAHAAVKGPGSQEETAWDDGTCYGRTQGNCPKYCEVHRECKCPVEYHYSPYTHTTTYTYTITTSKVASCSTTFAPYTTTVSCNDPYGGTTSTVATTTSTYLVCPSPPAPTACS